jgi:hypothetical protein
MVVTIHGRQRCDRHAEVARRHPEVHAELHEPSRGSVTQRVWHNIISETRSRPGARPGTSELVDPLVLPVDATMEKKPKAPTKRSLKDEQELEREDRAQKTERLRKLRLAKEAADREKNPSSNGRDEAQHAIKE